MTDPNVIEAIRKLARAVELLAVGDADKACMAVSKATDLLAAAEKPAAQTDGPVGIGMGGALLYPPGRAEKPAEAAPVVTGGIQYDPEGHALVADGRRAHVDPDGWFGFAGTERAGVYVEARGLESSRRAVRAMRDAGLAAVRGEAVAAPTVAAVEFNEQDRAEGREWFAFHATDRKRVSVTIDLRPGEDAGETVAKMLAACGRGP